MDEKYRKLVRNVHTGWKTCQEQPLFYPTKSSTSFAFTLHEPWHLVSEKPSKIKQENRWGIGLNSHLKYYLPFAF